MTARPRETYHFDGGLEQAVVDLIRVGSAGHASVVRQLANRLVRAVPDAVEDPVKFRAALRDAMAPDPPAGLRFGAGEVPTDQGGTDRWSPWTPPQTGSVSCWRGQRWRSSSR